MKNEITNFFKKILSIHEDKEREEKILETIKKGIEFRGASLWTLVFAIFNGLNRV